MNVLELPFDQYQRYKITEETINILRSPGQKFKILDVGGHPGLINEFLLEDDTFVVDKLECDIPNFQKADILDLPFKDGSFDIVTSVDVLEHIPTEKREKFLGELWRVSRNYILIAAPFDNPKVALADRILFEFIRVKLGYSHHFLDEHINYRLPNKDATINFFRRMGADTFSIPNGNLSRWLPMMIALFYMDIDPQFNKLQKLINSFYNENYYKIDNCEPCYRYAVVASKGELKELIVNNLHGLISLNNKDSHIDFSPALGLIELFNLDMIKEKDKELKEKEGQINNLTEQINNLKDFEGKVKSTLLYKVYRYLKLHKINARLRRREEFQAPKKLLLVCAAGIEQIRRAIQHFRGQYPDHEISLLISEEEVSFLTGRPGLFRAYVYRRRGEGLWRRALKVLRELRTEKFDLVVLVSPPGFRAPYLNLFILFSFFVKARNRLFFEGLKIRPLPLRRTILSTMDIALFKLGLPLARLGTLIVLFFARRIREKYSKDPRIRSGTIAFLLPILPDISHTFIYREVLSILARLGHERRVLVVALEEGSRSPLHDEAKELLAHTVFIPFYSLTQYLALYFYYLLSRPLRMARLIDFYSPHSHGDPWLFLHMVNLYGNHPMSGLMLARLLEKEDVSYIHCYGMSYPGTRALVASKLLDVPFSISTFVDFDYDYPFKCLKEKIQEARFVVTCTQFCKKRLIDLSDVSFEEKIHVIYHALDFRYRPTKDHHSLDPIESKPSIFTACRLVEKKGIEYLIQAYSLLKNGGLLHRCLIIGDGHERERLEDLVKQLDLVEKVRFLGALPNHRIWEIVGPEDICVVPSVHCSGGERDGIPVILLEALAHGHPVISTHISGIPELITNGVHGLLVPERDPEALACAIEILIKDGELRRRLVIAGQERVSKDFNIQDKVTQLLTLIDRNNDSVSLGDAKTYAMDESLYTAGEARSVSVILVNYNGLRFIEPLFDSIFRQTYKPKEIWFFDNASTDGSVEIVEARYPDVRVVKLDRNRGYSFPVNEGISRSSGQYILVLNVDLVLEDNFIEEMVRVLEEHPTAGWAAGKILKLTESGKSERIDCLGHHMSRSRYATETDYSRSFVWSDYDEDQFVFGASACAALYRRTMLDDLQLNGKYFDEDFFAYFEDVDLDWRAQQRGWKCIYTPKALGYHMRGGSGLIRQPEIAACFLANRWLMLVKNDTLMHLIQDFVPFTIRLARDICFYGWANPLALILAVKRFIKYLPKMIQKRRIIKAKRIVPLSYLRTFIR